MSLAYVYLELRRTLRYGDNDRGRDPRLRVTAVFLLREESNAHCTVSAFHYMKI